jgi:hypothetical protein
MSNNSEQRDDQSFERIKEKNITNSRKNRSFIDNILKSNDEYAIKKLFEEYFYLHAEKNNRDRITWDELRFIIKEILQRNDDEVTLNEATNIFYQMYQLQYSSTTTPIKLKKGENELSKEHNTSKNNKKLRNE